MIQANYIKQAGLEVPHSRYKKGLSAKKIMVGDRHNKWGQT